MTTVAFVAPNGYERWNRALRGACRKGFDARAESKPRIDPYEDKRTWRGSLTWSRSFTRAWLDGYDACAVAIESETPRLETSRGVVVG